MSSAPVSEKETSVQGEQWQEQAEEFKNLGNAAFKNKEHQQAIEFYGKAISLDPDNHVLYSNRYASRRRK
jgi:tetratricopeptide (TPR) repeat protein